MSPIMQQSPKAVAQVKDIIMDCIEDRDENIRLRALELIMTMATKKNITEIVRKLLGHIDTAESTFFRDTVIEKIITMCSYKSYAHITNFEWYITVLVEMTRFDGTRHGGLIASQLLDVTIRVKDVRPFSVKQMATIVENTHLFVSGTRNGVCEVLYAAAWIVGEFSEYLSDAYPVMEALLHPHVTELPGHIQAIFVQNIIKLYASILVKAEADGFTESIEEVGAMLVEKLPVFMQSGDLEVQERACGILQLMKYIVKLQSKGAAVADELQKLFVGDLNPVAAKAQRKVPIPEGLDLDQWINDPPSDSDNDKDDDKDDDMNFFGITTAGDAEQDYDEGKNKKRTKKSRKKRKGGKKRDGDGDDDEADYPNEEDDPEEMEKAREQRRQEIENNPHYLKGSIKPPKREITETTTAETTPTSHPSTKDIPVNRLELGIPLILDVSSESGSKKRGKKSKKKRKQMIEEDINNRPMVDTTSGELPEGAMLSDDEDNKRRERKKTDDDLAMKLDVNLDEPLRDDEVLPVRSHRVVIDTPTADTPPDEGTKKGKKKKKREESERRKKKKSTSRSKKTDEQEGSLIAIIDEDVTDTIQPAGDEESLDVQPVKEKKKKKKPTGVEEVVVDEGDKKMEDLDFWLTADDVPVSVGKVEEETTAAAEPPMKKEKKKSKKSKKQIKMEETQPAADDITGLLSLELDPPTSTASNDGTTFKLLAEDDSLSMTYDTKGSPMYNNQLTVAIVFSNKTSLQLVSMEFNVLDSLNTKLQRSVGASSQEGLPIPFQLPPGSANECQFIFVVQEFYMPQKLRGTVTYMTKSDDSTAHNKIDFKLCLNPSCFICPTPLPQDRFAALLSGGNLCETVTIKVPFVKTDSFPSALLSISTCLHVKLVEQVDDGASLYGQSIAGHHVCILVKDSGNSITVSGKGSDHRLISNLLDEVKTFV
jgi:AP-3 complex subunit delta-1